MWGRDPAASGKFLLCFCSLSAPAMLLQMGQGTEIGCCDGAGSQLCTAPSAAPAARGVPGSRERPGQARGGLACVFHSKPLQLIAAYEAEQVCDILLFASGEQR